MLYIQVLSTPQPVTGFNLNTAAARLQQPFEFSEIVLIDGRPAFINDAVREYVLFSPREGAVIVNGTFSGVAA